MPVILCEIKVGINPTDTSLVGDLHEHWLQDESNVARLTHWPDEIPGNFWNPIGDALRLNQVGTGSGSWYLDGGNILRII